jgi:MFS family permease
VVSVLFAAGALGGTLDILLYLKVPEPAARSRRRRHPATSHSARPGFLTFCRSFGRPFREARFRRLIAGMGLWSFSSNLVLPFLTVYQRGEEIGGQQLGLGASWLVLALFNVLGSVGGALTSQRWAAWGVRLGPRRLLMFGSGYLFVNSAYLLVGSGRGLSVLLAVACVSGALNAAWTVGTNQLLLGIAPREGRGYYVSAYNLTNGWLMAAGPVLGGVLADHLPVLPWQTPGGLPCCYFHVLLVAAMLGAGAALSVLRRLEVPGPQPQLAPPPLGAQVKLTRVLMRRARRPRKVCMDDAAVRS